MRKLREFIKYVPEGETIPDDTWRGRHRNILVLLLAHVPFLFLIGTLEGTESLVTGATFPAIPLWLVLAELGVLVVAAGLAYWSRFGRRARTGIASVGMVTASALLVQFSGGYIEAHFHFFVVMAVIAVYEDWLPFVLGIGYVSVQHGVFGMIDPSRVYNHAAAINNPWVWAFIHAAFVLGLAMALMTQWYSTERSREHAREQLAEARAKTDEVESLEQKKAEIEEAKAEAEAATAEAEARQREVERLNEHLEAKADAYSAAMAEAADGDLTVRLDAEGESEAMGRIAEAFNEMMTETEATMAEIQRFAREVSAASDDADASADAVTQASEAVGESIGEIASGANEQREMLETVSGEMTDLSATVEEVAASAEAVAEASHETAEIAEDGQETAEQAIADTRTVESAIDSTVDNVEVLDEQMAEIGDIIELISDVAEQTNILALNANIEAARAGEGTAGADGDGFAVVANEVKQLAEETRESATEIEQRIEETQAQTATTVEEARRAERHVQEATEAVQDAVDAFTKVAENAEETDGGIQEIRTTTDDQAASTEEAVSMVEEVADISQSTAAETDRAAEAAAEQSESLSEVDASVASLTEQADRLRTRLAKFDVEAAAARADGSGAPSDSNSL